MLTSNIESFFKYFQGHQDAKKVWAQLMQHKQLNVLCEELAKSYLRHIHGQDDDHLLWESNHAWTYTING